MPKFELMAVPPACYTAVMSSHRPAMSRPLRSLLDSMRITDCALLHPNLQKPRESSNSETKALRWHRDKHEVDGHWGLSDLGRSRLQIAHVRSWPATKELSLHLPLLIAQRRFHSLANVALLCAEAHDLYDGTALIGTSTMLAASALMWERPEARDPLELFLRTTINAPGGHQTENTNVLHAAEVLTRVHGAKVDHLVGAWEQRLYEARRAIDHGEAASIHRGDEAVFAMPRFEERRSSASRIAM
ncbi:hypothetical protein [Kitasatospora sp. NPDC058478]|uniref:hypothetical protein n=1 Tax=unclassified Kitasatospora TaxID=2633591 RepID=UPI00365282D1